eukprot:c2279_g1_i1.p1 GENE.c2279_g1_i1~~c2279_g1_i1.p1  ORF type:complete len:215 (-),score=27.40 c2279_g1_i1:147-710(-)
MAKRILINRCYGGFGFSEQFIKFVAEREPTIGSLVYKNRVFNIDVRTNPILISLFEEFQRAHQVPVLVTPKEHDLYSSAPNDETSGRGANGYYASIWINEIPQEYALYDCAVQEYDGMEWLELEFPWESIAVALLEKNDNDPMLKALRSGQLQLPYEIKGMDLVHSDPDNATPKSFQIKHTRNQHHS